MPLLTRRSRNHGPVTAADATRPFRRAERAPAILRQDGSRSRSGGFGRRNDSLDAAEIPWLVRKRKRSSVVEFSRKALRRLSGFWQRPRSAATSTSTEAADSDGLCGLSTLLPWRWGRRDSVDEGGQDSELNRVRREEAERLARIHESERNGRPPFFPAAYRWGGLEGSCSRRDSSSSSSRSTTIADLIERLGGSPRSQEFPSSGSLSPRTPAPRTTRSNVSRTVLVPIEGPDESVRIPDAPTPLSPASRTAFLVPVRSSLSISPLDIGSPAVPVLHSEEVCDADVDTAETSSLGFPSPRVSVPASGRHSWTISPLDIGSPVLASPRGEEVYDADVEDLMDGGWADALVESPWQSSTSALETNSFSTAIEVTESAATLEAGRVTEHLPRIEVHDAYVVMEGAGSSEKDPERTSHSPPDHSQEQTLDHEQQYSLHRAETALTPPGQIDLGEEVRLWSALELACIEASERGDLDEENIAERFRLMYGNRTTEAEQEAASIQLRRILGVRQKERNRWLQNPSSDASCDSDASTDVDSDGLDDIVLV